MTTANPYAAPAATDFGDNAATYSPQVFSFSGRIGRLRYLAYGMIWNLAIMVAGALLVGISGVILTDGTAMLGLVSLIYAAMLVPMFAMAVRRLNDLNHSGWLSLIMLVPLANLVLGLYMLFAPGTRGSNKYGPAPSPNSALTVVLFVLLVVAMVGIMAAVAIPAYQDYVMRAQELQQLQ